MTMMSSAAAPPARSGILGGLLRLIRVLGDTFITYWLRHDAIKTLRQLDDRTLRDIGISRCQIETAVTGNFDLELMRIR